METPLSRLRSITIAKEGISISSNLVQACAMRGIRIFFAGWDRKAYAAMIGGINQHGTVAIRQAQFRCVENGDAFYPAREIIATKVRNQRAVLLYFGKYLNKSDPEKGRITELAAEKLKNMYRCVKEAEREGGAVSWQDSLMGYEGRSALVYWQGLCSAGLMPASFVSREGRGSHEIANAALNYGYAILRGYAWSSLENAGLELYAGVLHAPRPGKASLVLDFMEEYRAWIVDRNIIKLRGRLAENRELTPALRKQLSAMVNEAMKAKITYHGKDLSVENVMQRQAYRFAASFMTGEAYKGVRFRW